MKHLQFHGLYHIFAFSKPEHQIVAFFHALSAQSNSMIKVSQFISPLFCVVSSLKLLQHSYTFFQTYILCLVKLVLKYVSSAIFWRNLHKLFVILNRHNKIAHFNRQFTQRINDRPSTRMSVVCQKQQISTVLKSSIYLVQITDCTKHHYTFHSAPIDSVRNLRCLHILFLRNQFFDFF